MSIATAVLQGGVVLGTSTATIYTVPTGHTAWVKRAVLTNVTGAAATVTVNVSRATGGSFVLIPARSIAAGLTDLAPEMVSLALGAGDGISASASAAGAISVVISGLTT